MAAHKAQRSRVEDDARVDDAADEFAAGYVIESIEGQWVGAGASLTDDEYRGERQRLRDLGITL